MLKDTRPHPYLPHTAGDSTQQMLDRIGADTVDELFADIPRHMRQREPFGLPPALRSEGSLVRHVRQRLDKNTPCTSVLNFCGWGTYQHFVPSVCREIAQRAEFVSAYAGEPYEDHGKFQALFEYQSLMAELLEMDVVSIPTYDGGQAAGTAMRMAGRITGRHRVVVSGRMRPDMKSKVEEYAAPVVTAVEYVDGTEGSAELDERLDHTVAAVFLELPDAAGRVDADVAMIAEMAHKAGAICIVAIDPIALGLLAAPSTLGADIVCGELQSLGNGMYFGGAHAGFLAVHDDERFVYELPTRLYGLAPTERPGEAGFIDLAYERTSLAARENGVEWIGTASSLHGIVAGTFLSLHGPQGMKELSGTIFDRTCYAIDRLNGRAGCSVVGAEAPHFREFILQLPGDGVSAPVLLERLASRNIFGGVQLDERTLVISVTEVHTQADIDTFAEAIEEVLS